MKVDGRKKHREKVVKPNKEDALVYIELKYIEVVDGETKA